MAQATTETTETAPPPPARLRRLAGFLAPLLVVLVALVLVPLHVHDYTKVSPVDELQHIDYLFKAPAMVEWGDKVGDQAMQEEACRGLDYPMALPPCIRGGHYDPSQFQERGYNSAAVNTPLYYTLTKAFAEPFEAITGRDLVTGGRLAGALWLSAGLLVAYAAGRRLGAGRWQVAAVLVIVTCAQSTLFQSSTITPDATALLAGAASLLAVLLWEEAPRRRWWVLLVAVALVWTLKATHILVWFALGTYMLLRLVDLLRGRRAGRVGGISGTVTATRGQLLLGGGVVLGTFVVLQEAWTKFSDAQAHGTFMDVPMNQTFAVTSLSPSHVWGALGVFLDPLESWIVPVGPLDYVASVQRLAGLLIVGGLVGVALFGDKLSRVRTLAQSFLLVGVFGASGFVVLSYVAQSLYVPPPVRYGATLVPVMAVVTAWALRTRAAVITVCCVAGVLFLATVYRFVAF